MKPTEILSWKLFFFLTSTEIVYSQWHRLNNQAKLQNVELLAVMDGLHHALSLYAALGNVQNFLFYSLNN